MSTFSSNPALRFHERWAKPLSFAAIIAFVAGVVFVEVTDPSPTTGEQLGGMIIMGLILVVGSFLTIKRPDNTIGWLLQGSGLAAVVSESLRIVGEDLGASTVKPSIASTILAEGGSLLYGMVFVQLILVFLFFPSGSVPSPRWRRVPSVLLIAVGTSLTVQLSLTVIDAHWSNDGSVFRQSVYGVATVLAVASSVAAITIWASSAVALVLRFRRGGDEERHQIKWLAFPAAMFTAYAIGTSFAELVTDEDLPVWTTDIFAALILLLPLGIAVAVLKYRLYEIDLIINRTLVYGPLTAVLAGTFTAGILFFRLIFVDTLGVSSDAAIATTTLALAVVAMPVKNRIQSLVDRFFKEDERRRLKGFETNLAKSLDALHPPSMIGEFLRRVESMVGVPVRVLIADGRYKGFHPGDRQFESVRKTIPIQDGAYVAGSVQLGSAPIGGFRETDLARIESAAGQVARLIRVDNHHG